MVCVIDSKYARSTYCINELIMAQSCGLQLFPVLLGDMRFDRLPPGLRYGLAATNVIPFPNDRAKPNAMQASTLVAAMARVHASEPGPNTAPAGGAGGGPALPAAELAPVPPTAPALPVGLSPRGDVHRQLVESLTAAPGPDACPRVTLVHGMGGIGKTTLASMVVRDAAVRRHYERVGFLVLGASPDLLPLQRNLFYQLTGNEMPSNTGPTVTAQLEALTAAAAGRQWLVVLDDIWELGAFTSLDIIGNAAPDSGAGNQAQSQIVVTTRFGALLPEGERSRRFPVGLLTVAEAAHLLLRTAQLEPTAARTEPAMAIAELCAGLPLFVILAARMVQVHLDGDAWQTEVLAQLSDQRESRAVPLGAADEASLGERIVGSSLASLHEDDTREVFSALAVCAEDVPTPAGALELIWCAYIMKSPPLSRAEALDLQRRVFHLLDMSLLLGEHSAEGVRMHDVVRETCRARREAGSLRQQHRQLVRLLIAATPEQGWGSSVDALSAYTSQSLRWHMSESLDGVDDVTSDDEAMGWLSSDAIDIPSNLVLMSALNALGAEVLGVLADRALSAGDPFTAGLRLAGAAVTDRYTGSYRFQSDGSTEAQEKLLVRAADLCAEGSLPGSKDYKYRRTVELGIRVLIIGTTQVGSSLFDANLLKIGSLREPPGVLDPDTFGGYLTVSVAAGWTACMYYGCMVGGAGNHLNEDSVRKGAKMYLEDTELTLKAIAMVARPDPRRYATFGGYDTFCYGNCGTWAMVPDVDVADVYTLAVLQEFVVHLDWAVHSPLAVRSSKQGWDGLGIMDPVCVITHRYGELAMARTYLAKLIAAHEPGGAFERGPGCAPPVNGDYYAVAALAPHLISAARVVAGLANETLRLGARLVDGDPFGDELGAAVAGWMQPVLTAFRWEQSGISWFSAAYTVDNFKLGILLASLTADPRGDLAMRGRWWLTQLQPGHVCTTPHDGGGRVYDVCQGQFCADSSFIHAEPWAWELLNRPGAATESVAIHAQRFPFQIAAHAWNDGVIARALIGGGDVDGGIQMLERGAERAHKTRACLVEMLLRRDLVIHGTCASPGAESAAAGNRHQGARIAALGRAIAPMTGDRGELSRLLGAGLDAAEAEAATNLA